jgi:predicted RNA methylase
MAKTRQTAEFGDFQTPIELAKRVCTLLLKRGVAPRTIIEPNCGKGAFLKASVEAFESASRIHGLDINPEYIEVARKRLPSTVRLRVADFFTTNWQQLLSDCPEPVLFIGNPPWVTNSALGSLQSANLPKK